MTISQMGKLNPRDDKERAQGPTAGKAGGLGLETRWSSSEVHAVSFSDMHIKYLERAVVAVTVSNTIGT